MNPRITSKTTTDTVISGPTMVAIFEAVVTSTVAGVVILVVKLIISHFIVNCPRQKIARTLIIILLLNCITKLLLYY